MRLTLEMVHELLRQIDSARSPVVHIEYGDFVLIVSDEKSPDATNRSTSADDSVRQQQLEETG